MLVPDHCFLINIREKIISEIVLNPMHLTSAKVECMPILPDVLCMSNTGTSFRVSSWIRSVPNFSLRHPGTP